MTAPVLPSINSYPNRRTFVAGTIAAVAAPFVLGKAHASERQLSGSLSGANYAIRVPENWNGTLLLFAHPYRLAEDPKSFDPNLTFAPAEAGYFPELEPLLIGKGYALAAAAFRRQGYAVREGIEDCAAVAAEFHKTIGKPRQTILYGTSLGSLIALEGAENPRGLYDGVILLSGLSSGGRPVWDRVFDFALAFDVAFGWPDAWGKLGAIRSDVSFGKDVVPVLRQLLSDKANIPQFEFMRAVGGFPPLGYYDGKMPNPWLFGNMFFATYGVAELQKRAGGNPLQSARGPYALAEQDAARLKEAGADVSALVQALNHESRQINPEAGAREYLAKNYSPSGNLKTPVLSVHSRNDGFAPISNESALKSNVAKAGRSANLVQAYTEVVGHNAFSAEQMMASFTAMETWISNGKRPTEASFLQGAGFLTGYEPPVWPTR